MIKFKQEFENHDFELVVNNASTQAKMHIISTIIRYIPIIESHAFMIILLMISIFLSWKYIKENFILYIYENIRINHRKINTFR